MTTLFELMRDLAIRMNETRGGIVSSVPDGNSIIDDDDPEEGDYWKNGTLFMDATCAPYFVRRVTHYSGGLFMFNGDSTCPMADDSYTVAKGKFTLRQLKQAINAVLTSDKVHIVRIDTTHTAAAGECTLTDVSNVKRVYVDGVRNYHWTEADGKIIFDDEEAAGSLSLWYLAPHGELADYDDELNPTVKPDYVIEAAAERLWRAYIASRSGKDDQTAIDFFNEAKQGAQLWYTEHARKLPGRDPHYADW